LHLAVSYDG